MKNSVTVKITSGFCEIKANIDGKKYAQKWIKTITGAKTTYNDFDDIKDEKIFEALDSLNAYDVMSAL